MDEIIIDSFAGGGGTFVGIEAVDRERIRQFEPGRDHE
jgi:hypothetical protein